MFGRSRPDRVAYSGDPDEFRLTLVEHLEELRDRIIRSLTVVGLAWLGGWFVSRPVYEFLNQRVVSGVKQGLGSGVPYQEVWHQISEPFLFKFKFSFLLGLIVALPYLIVQLWGFIAPALKPSEQRPFKRLAPVSGILFLMGVGFAWLIMPATMAWFADYTNDFPGTKVNQEAGSMVIFIIKMLLAFGAAFQLPVVVFGLGSAGLLSAETLIKYWRHAASLIFVLAAIITPSNDPLSMLTMAIPLTLLFMISVYAVKFVQRKQVRPEHQDNVTPQVLSLGEPIAYQEDETEQEIKTSE